MSELNQQLITEAIDSVLSMDLEDSAFTDAFNAELKGLNGTQLNEYWSEDLHYTLQ